MFSGCVPGSGTNLTANELRAMCSAYAVTVCVGDRRCCLDCKVAHPFDAPQPPENVAFDFVDKHCFARNVIVTGVLMYVVIYGVLAIMKALESNMSSKLNKKATSPTQSHRHYKHALVGIILIIGFLLSISMTIYCIFYVSQTWDVVKACQTTLLYLLSWTILSVLASVDYALSFFAITARILTVNKTTVTSAVVLLQACLTKFVDLIGGLLIIWWAFLIIYLEGAYNGRWRITL